jgi:hypothetical protein
LLVLSRQFCSMVHGCWHACLSQNLRGIRGRPANRRSKDYILPELMPCAPEPLCFQVPTLTLLALTPVPPPRFGHVRPGAGRVAYAPFVE